MKFTPVAVLISTLALAPVAQAGWLDSIKSFLGLAPASSATAEPASTENSAPAVDSSPSISGMLAAVSSQLGVSEAQASGGMASLFNYAKGNLSADKFAGLSAALPGLGDLLSQVPAVSEGGTEGGLGGLLDQAANYSDSLKAVNEVKKQFEALGLSPEMISQFVTVAKQYLDSEQGQQIKTTLSEGLSKLIA